MIGFIGAALDKKRAVLVTLAFLFIGGFSAWNEIPKESNPDISIPIIYVSTSLEGISPEDAERLLIRPMEEQLGTVDGVKEMRATGYQGGGNVILEFNAGFDADQALDDVRNAVDKAKPDLPEDANEPVVSEVNFSLFPVVVVSLSGDVPERTLVRLAKDLQDKLEDIPQVLEVRLVGSRDEQVEIVVDPAKVASYGLSGNDIMAYFARSDRLVAAGNIDTGGGRFAVKVPGLFETAADIENMPLKAHHDSVVRVRDVAEVRRNFKDADSYARLNGKNTIALEIVKRTGENVIETIAAVRASTAQESAHWPPGVRVDYTQDGSKKIRDMLADLQNNLVSAVILVMVVCVGALGLTSSLLVGIAIPGSFLAGMLVLNALGFTLNVVVLFSLILVVGMLVDGAVVVVEYADRRMIEGASKASAYREAAQMMAWPVISSLVTHMVAFLPLLFWPGVVGQFMGYMPRTLIIVLTASLAMALIFIPVIGAMFGRVDRSSSDETTIRAMSGESVDGLHGMRGFTGLYVRFLSWALNWPALVIATAFALLIGVQVYHHFNGHGVKFFPDVEPDVASVQVHARGNLSLDEQDRLVRAVEGHVLGLTGIKTLYTRVGGGGAERNQAEDVIGDLQMEFSDWNTRPRADLILEDIRARTADIPGIRVETVKEKAGPQGAKAIEMQLRAIDPSRLAPAIEKLRRGLDGIGGFVDIEDSRPLPGIEWVLEIDKAQAAKFGLDVTTIGQALRMVTNGLKISEYRPDDSRDEIDVVLRYPLDDRSIDQLDRIRVETAQGSVPVSNFIKRVASPRVGRIERADGFRVMKILADVPPGGNATAKIGEIREWLKTAGWDNQVGVKFKGDDEKQQESQAFLQKAFGAALFLITLILVLQFNNFYHTLLILSAVIMATIGVFLGLIITGRPFGIVMTGIGIIALAGAIVTNNIVLIDTFDHLRKLNRFSLREVILLTGAQRLRPVLLTAGTTALGLVPMVFQVNIDFIKREVTMGAPSTQWWVDLSTAIAFGMVFATPLTLIVTPCALMMRHNAVAFFQGLSQRWKRT